MRPNTVIVAVTQANRDAVLEWLARETPALGQRAVSVSPVIRRNRCAPRVRHAPRSTRVGPTARAQTPALA